MMDNELNDADSHRAIRLAEKFHNKEYRDTYVESHTRRFLAHQIRKFRGERSQVEFGDILNKSQTIVWRLEDPNYSGWSLRTLFQVAQKLNVAVIARFVDFQTFLRFTDDTSESALNPDSYDEAIVDRFALDKAATWKRPAHQNLYINLWQANQGVSAMGYRHPPRPQGVISYPNALAAPLYAGQTFPDTTSQLLCYEPDSLLTRVSRSQDSEWIENLGGVDPRRLAAHGFVGQQPPGRAT
jgi:hypothetical protein